MSSRFLIVAPIAVIVTVALFFLMRDLISAPPDKPDEVVSEEVKITREIDDTESKPKERDLQPPDVEPDIQPAKPDHEAARESITTDTTIKDTDGPPAPNGTPGEIGIFQIDGSATPLIRGEPPYPPCGRGNGEVVLEFFVEPDGSVGDVKVVSATSSCFARAAERAAQRWRYRPEVVDGKAVRSGLQRVKVQFVEGR